MPTKSQSNSRSGQAMIEMVVGLIAILLLIAGLLQIGHLGLEHTRAMMTARERADVYAMDTAYRHHSTPPIYVLDWQPGRDGVRYSQHDEAVGGPFMDIHHNVIRHAHPTEVNRLVGPNPLQYVQTSGRFTDGLHLVRGHANSQQVPVYPLLQRLVVRDEWIRMEHTVWMPWTRGLDE